MSDVVELHTIGLGAAQRVLAAAVAEAEAMGKPMCVAVCGVGGDLRLFARMDGAPELSESIAKDKAWTVTAFNGVPTHAWWDAIKDEPALVHGITKTDRFIIFGGGVPLRAGGRLVGAIGVSGGSADDDRQVAEAGAAALGS
jgi:glc operon protein GlcG